MRKLTLLLLALSLFAALARGQQRTQPWPADVVRQAATLPIQHEGRVKPLSTYAMFLLLRIRGIRGCPTPGGEYLTPTEWLLDALFYPQQARDYAVFLVDNADVLDAIGLTEVTRKKRDRYSYAELKPGLAMLRERAGRFQGIDPKQQTIVQGQTLRLHRDVEEFEFLVTALDFARHEVAVPAALAGMFAERTTASLSVVLDSVPEIVKRLDQDDPAQHDAAVELSRAIGGQVHGARLLALFPPAAAQPEASPWWTGYDVAMAALETGKVIDGHARIAATLETMVRRPGEIAPFSAALDQLHRDVTAAARARGEGTQVGLEDSYYRLDLLGKSQILYVLAFLVVVLTWLWPRLRWLQFGAFGLVGLATLPLIASIVMRCIVRGRPPISTFYETILFIAATGVIAGLVTELWTRRRLALPVAAFMGVAGLFIASRHEAAGNDTMPQLVAVLDTNFWLATHVTTVTFGYSAGLLAGLLGHVYLFLRLFRVRKDPSFYRSLARMIYGVICFGLLLSLIGTILGGVWANDSWGRFWGWDPKENGALMICIAEIAILHARMGGYIRELGIALAAILNTAIVVFSWWGVNMLGVGLHSYGFTEGAMWVWAFWGFEALLLVVGGCVWWFERTHPLPLPEEGAAVPHPGSSSLAEPAHSR